jgi:small-conductance mechanosensitive channel
MWEIESALRRHGVEIPLPQRDLRFRNSAKEVEKLPTELAGHFAPQLTKS